MCSSDLIGSLPLGLDVTATSIFGGGWHFDRLRKVVDGTSTAFRKRGGSRLGPRQGHTSSTLVAKNPRNAGIQLKCLGPEISRYRGYYENSLAYSFARVSTSSTYQVAWL